MANKEFRLTSMLNISFDHVVSSNVDQEEWDEMSEDERREELADIRHEHIDVAEVFE